MADSKLSALTALTTYDGAELTYIVDDPSGTPASKNASIDNLLDGFLSFADGTMLNGKISVTVASNNIIVALKTRAGNNPSTTEAVWSKINGTWRKITTTLSVTVNAGANTFNAGSSELATILVQYFCYLGWRAASSAVVLGFARIPYATLYSDFSATATNEKYAAFSTAPASTDDVVNIGRFSATLSAGAGYTWTVPTFTSANLIQKPCFETDWLNWAPVSTGFSADPTNTVYEYKIDGKNLGIVLRQATNGTSNATGFTLTLPMASKTITNMVWNALAGTVIDNGTSTTTPGKLEVGSGATAMTIYKDYASGAWTAANGKRVGSGSVWYEIG